MIYFLYGENNFLVRRQLKSITDMWPDDSNIERYDAEEMTVDDLPNILQTMSLFSLQKYVIILNPSRNKSLWGALEEYLSSLSDIDLVLIDESPDKRTKTFKQLQKQATVFEGKPFSESEAIAWLKKETADRNITMTSEQARRIVMRAGRDAWQLHFALEKVASLDNVTDDQIDDLVEAHPEESVFGLIDAALGGNVAVVQKLVSSLQSEQDPYQFFGLLSQQLYQLVTLAVSGKSPSEVAKDLGVHPFPLQKMHAIAKQLSRADIKEIVTLLAQCDDDIKRSGFEPWFLIEQALTKLALIRR